MLWDQQALETLKRLYERYPAQNQTVAKEMAKAGYRISKHAARMMWKKIHTQKGFNHALNQTKKERKRT